MKNVISEINYDRVYLAFVEKIQKKKKKVICCGKTKKKTFQGK